MQNLLVPVLIFVMMLCVGISLTLEDFRRVFAYPRAVITGLTGQLLVLPTVAFAAAWFMVSSVPLKIGMVLNAACPGGPLSNSLVYMARGNVALSVSLTAISSVLALVTTPFIAGLGIAMFAGQNADIKLPIVHTVMQIFLMVVLPVCIGMLIRVKKKDIIQVHGAKMKLTSLISTVLMSIIVIIANYQTVLLNFRETIIPALGLCAVNLAIGHIGAKMMNLDRDTQFTVGVEVSVHNIVLAILIATVILDRPELALFSLTYGMGAVTVIIFPWTLLYAYRRARRPSKAVPVSLKN